ncbi:hypothetical protein ABZT27_33130, partial [Streptomyces sp. NPDC005389]
MAGGSPRPDGHPSGYHRTCGGCQAEPLRGRAYTGGQSEVQAEGATLAEVIADLEKNHTGIAA